MHTKLAKARIQKSIHVHKKKPGEETSVMLLQVSNKIF